MNRTVGMISLGCPKNQVDGEIMLKKLQDGGYKIEKDVARARVLIVNTCGFIEAAQREAIDTIFSAIEMRENDGTETDKIIVTGCLAERYAGEVMKEIPEVDAVIGIGENANILNVVNRVLDGEKYESFPAKDMLPLDCERYLLTPKHWTYLKISEGCNNRCSYCAIPYIRGNLRSRTVESIVSEAERLVRDGVKELIIVAQDTTRYGEDIYGRSMLCELLKEIVKIEGDFSVRMLYCYPEKITDELLELVASESKILNYFDIPLQHCNENILKRMNRRGSRETLTALINKIRAKIPDVCIRTTLMVGFPGEGEDEFEELINFVKDLKFDRLGCFAFSKQEGTKAYDMPDEISEDVKQRRLEIVMQEQIFISEENNKKRLGNVYKAAVDSYNEDEGMYFARSYFDAPEIDSVIKFRTNNKLLPGTLVNLKIMGYDDYDLIGEVV